MRFAIEAATDLRPLASDLRPLAADLRPLVTDPYSPQKLRRIGCPLSAEQVRMAWGLP